MPGQAPSFVSTSLWQTPQACTLMRTCPAPGSGISRSTIWKSAPALGICATFIGAIATFVVAMIPPSESFSRARVGCRAATKVDLGPAIILRPYGFANYRKHLDTQRLLHPHARWALTASLQQRTPAILGGQSATRKVSRTTCQQTAEYLVKPL